MHRNRIIVTTQVEVVAQSAEQLKKKYDHPLTTFMSEAAFKELERSEPALVSTLRVFKCI